MHNLFEEVTNSHKEQNVTNYIISNKDDENNIPISIIKQVLENKLQEFQNKYSKLNLVSLKFQYYQNQNIASVNQYDLNVIHINLWKFIMQIYDDIIDYDEKIKFNYGDEREDIIKHYKDFVTSFVIEFEDQYKIIGHQLSHIIDYEYNGYKENIHDEDWEKIFEKIVGTTPNPKYFVD